MAGIMDVARRSAERLHPGDAALDLCFALLMVLLPAATIGVLLGRLHWTTMPMAVAYAVAMALALSLIWFVIGAVIAGLRAFIAAVRTGPVGGTTHSPRSAPPA